MKAISDLNDARIGIPIASERSDFVCIQHNVQPEESLRFPDA